MIATLRNQFPTFVMDLLAGRREVWWSSVGTMFLIIMGGATGAQGVPVAPGDLATMAAGPMALGAVMAAAVSVVSGAYIAWRAIRDGKEWPRSPTAEAIYSGLLSMGTAGLMAGMWLAAKGLGFSDINAFMVGLVGPFMIQVFLGFGLAWRTSAPKIGSVRS